MENDNKKDLCTYVTNDSNQKAFKLIRSSGGVLQAEIKTRTRDRNVPPYIYVDAIEMVDQVVDAMTQEERVFAYTRLSGKLNKS